MGECWGCCQSRSQEQVQGQAGVGGVCAPTWSAFLLSTLLSDPQCGETAGFHLVPGLAFPRVKKVLFLDRSGSNMESQGVQGWGTGQVGEAEGQSCL